MELHTLFYIVLTLSGTVHCTLKELKEGECLDENQNKICCAMYHIIDGSCVECNIGTYRLRQHTHCVKCKPQYYGERCIYRCNCGDNEECDPVDGRCDCKDTENHLCIKRVGLSTTKQTSTATISVITHNGTIEFDSTVTEEPTTKHVLSYGLPGVLLIGLIVFIVFIIKWKMTRTIQTGENQHKNDTSIPLECEYGYALIDESKLIEQPEHLPKSQKTGDNVHYCDENMLSGTESPSCGIGSSKEKKAGRMSDEYLQPVFENIRLSTGNESDRSDSSIKTDVPVNSDTYLHPYNTLSPDWRSRTHVYNDEEPEVKGDGYLNPYQPLQENWLQSTDVYNTAKKTNVSSEKQADEDVITEDCRSKQSENVSSEIGQN